jgi:hypothetical protein
VGDHYPPAQQLGQPREHRLRRRRGVDHRLRDPGEALDRAAEPLARGHQRLVAIVQLPAADQHRPHLGQLARLARAAVGLRVDGNELHRAQRRVLHPTRDSARIGRGG